MRMPTEVKKDFKRVAVVANDALGNYVVSTPLLQGIRTELSPDVLDYYSGPRVQEFWSQDPRISRGISIWGRTLQEVVAELPAEPYDLVINMEMSGWAKAITAMLSGPETVIVGPSLDPSGRKDLPFEENERGDLWRDQEWISENLNSKYPFMRTGFIGEMFYRLAYLVGELPPYIVPTTDCGIEVPDVLIAMSASLPDKLWPVEKWLQTISKLKAQGLSIGLLGAKPAVGKHHWLGGEAEDLVAKEVRDLRGTLSLTQVADALSQPKLVLTLDNGILHIAAAGGASVVGLFRHGIHRLWAPPVRTMAVLTPGEGHEVSEIEVSRVLEASSRTMG